MSNLLNILAVVQKPTAGQETMNIGIIIVIVVIIILIASTLFFNKK